jgi:arsenate reductase
MAANASPVQVGADGAEVVLHGIAQCDQVRKAKAWLTSEGISYRFHDYRAEGLDASLIDRWLQRLPWDALLNRRGTSWRKLDERQRLAVTDQLSARAAMLAEPLLVKRPVVEHDGRLLVGFSEPLYTAFFGSATTQGSPQ